MAIGKNNIAVNKLGFNNIIYPELLEKCCLKRQCFIIIILLYHSFKYKIAV